MIEFINMRGGRDEFIGFIGFIEFIGFVALIAFAVFIENIYDGLYECILFL